jgi:chromosomal replication initiator protein
MRDFRSGTCIALKTVSRGRIRILVNNVVRIPLLGRPLGKPDGSSGLTGKPLRPEQFLIDEDQGLIRIAVEQALGPNPQRYNPLVVTGSSGCGKSHLAQGIAFAWRELYPRCRLIVTSATDFARDYLDASREGSLETFRARYFQSQLCVIEDLHQLNDRHRGPRAAQPMASRHVTSLRLAAQAELAMLCDELIRRNTPLIVTIGRSSEEAATANHDALEPRLVSRLNGGLTVTLKLPSRSLRGELLSLFARLRGLRVTTAAVELLAGSIKASPQELLATLNGLELLAGQGTHPQIDQALVEEYLSQLETPKQPTLQEIAQRTARHFGLRVSQLRSPDRHRLVVQARSIAMFLARELTGESYERIGRFHGNRDHTTVLYNCRQIEQSRQQEPTIREALNTLRARLNPRGFPTTRDMPVPGAEGQGNRTAQRNVEKRGDLKNGSLAPILGVGKSLSS